MHHGDHGHGKNRYIPTRVGVRISISNLALLCGAVRLRAAAGRCGVVRTGSSAVLRSLRWSSWGLGSLLFRDRVREFRAGFRAP